MGRWGLLVARARAQSGVLAAAVALLLVAAVVVTGVVAYGQAAAVAGLRAAVRDIPAEQAGAEVRTQLIAHAAAQDAAVRENVADLAGDAAYEIARSTRTGLLDVLEPPVEDERLVAFSYQDLPEHADLVVGDWPEGSGEAALHTAAAERLGLAVGDRVTVEGATAPVTLTISGIWSPTDEGDPYFLGDELEVAGDQSDTVTGPLVVGDVVAAGLDDRPDVRWRIWPEADRIEANALGQLASAVAGLRQTMDGDPRVGGAVQVDTAVVEPLRALQTRVVVARSVSVLPAVLVAALAGGALLLVARLLADARQGETALIRARGASARQVGTSVVTEALLLALPVALVAAPLAVVVAGLVGVRPSLTERLWLGGAFVAVAGAVLLLLPSLGTARRWSVVDGSSMVRGGRRGAVRTGVDIVLVAFAALSLWQLQLYTTAVARRSTGVLVVDPLLVAAPALGLLAGAFVAVRLLPRLAALGQKLLARRRRLPPVLVAWEVARRPVSHAVPLVLVALSVATGVFAAGYAATWRGLQEDVAVQRAAADVRVLAPSGASDVPPVARAGTYAGIDGVEAVTTVSSSASAASSTDLELLAVDTATADRTADLASGEDQDAVLQQVRPATDAWPGVPLPEGTSSVTVDLLVSQTGFERGAGYIGDGPEVEVTLYLASGTGEVLATPAVGASLEVPGEQVPLSVTADLPALPAGAGGWTLLGLDTAAQAVGFAGVTTGLEYTAEVTSLAADGAAVEVGGVEWALLELTRPVGVGQPDVEVTGEALPVVDVLMRPGPSGALVARIGPEAIEAEGDPPAAVVTTALANRNGISSGDQLTITRRGVETDVRVAGVSDRLPGVAGPAALVDLRALSAYDFGRGVDPPEADEWWLAVDDDLRAGSAASSDDDVLARVVAAVRAVDGAPAEVVVQEYVAASLQEDPLGGASVRAFDLGLLAAVVLTAAGLAVGAAVTARRRRVEVAVLRAVGLTSGQVRRMLASEQVAVAGIAIPAGLVVGAGVAWLALPHLVLPADAGERLRPVVQFSLLLAALVLAGVVVAVALAVAGRWWAARRRPPAADVRLGADL